MVKSTQDVAGDDAAAALNGSAMWGIFLQAEMGPCRVVIRSVFLQDAPKMGLAPHDHVVKTLTSDRADRALDISVLPWRSRRDRAVANAHRPTPSMTNANRRSKLSVGTKSLPLQFHRRDCAEMSSNLAKAVFVLGACI